MRRMSRIFAVSLIVLALFVAGLVLPGRGWAQAKTELTVALSSFSTETLDPALGGHIVKYYLSLMFDYLVGSTPDGQPSPNGGIATKWENSPDHRRWTFHLRKGVKFHNGDDVMAEDVKFSLQRAMGKRSTTGYAGPLRTLIQDIETPAVDRIVIVTKEPTLIIPTYLSRALSTEGMVLPKKYIETAGDDGFARKPVGSGPYRFVEQVTGSHIRLSAVDSHWRTGSPKYKTITFKLVPEETTRIALLRRGEVDIADVSRERVKELEREAYPIHFRREEAVLSMWWVLAPDGWPAPVKDKRVREALNIAVDRAEVAQSIFGGYADPASIPMGLSWSFREIGLKVTPEMAYAYDPARAKKLLADAGHPSGFALDVYAYQLPGLPEGKAFAEGIAGYWEKIGIKTKLIPVDYPAFRKAWVDRKVPGAVGYYNIANRNWIGTFALLEKMAYSPSKPNDTAADPEIDGMIAQVMSQTDREKINGLLRNVYLRLRSEHLGLPVVYLHSPYATSKTLGKWNPGTVMYDFFLDDLASGK
jgi:peptide/nickel transport system substrate-binding protein